jgi:hypothetical protein
MRALTWCEFKKVFKWMVERQADAKSMKNKVCIIGSGNWGSAIALAVGVNAAAHPELFESQV